MKRAKTWFTVAILLTVGFLALGALVTARNWWTGGGEAVTSAPSATATATVTVTADGDTDTGEGDDTSPTETETAASEPTETTTEAWKEPQELALEDARETVAELSGEQRTDVREVLTACMAERGSGIHNESFIQACLAGDIADWSADSARRSGEVTYP